MGKPLCHKWKVGKVGYKGKFNFYLYIRNDKSLLRKPILSEDQKLKQSKLKIVFIFVTTK